MSVFVLVHGSYHGSWCWDYVVSGLEEKGHTAVPVDLSIASYKDNEVQLQDYVNKVIEAACAQTENICLLGHSSGGHIISAVAELIPEKIKSLIYLTAVLLPSGRNATELPREKHEIPIYPRSTIVNGIKRYLLENEQDRCLLINYFYNDCKHETAQRAIHRLCAQPIAPLATPIFLTPERFGSVRKGYIECLQDNVIFPSVQRKMQSYWPLDFVYSIHSGHSPFLSVPDELSTLLNNIMGECSD